MTVYVNWPPIGGAQFPIPESGNVDWSDLSNYLVALASAQGTGSQKIGIRIAVLSPVTVLSATDCVIVTDLLTPGAVAVNLPAGVNGQLFVCIDGKGDAGTNNITITPNGTDTINDSSNLILNKNFSAVMIVYANGNWTIVGSYKFGSVLTYTANRVLISDGSGEIAASSVTTTTLGYLDATGSIQTQLDSKVDENAPITGATKTKITYDAKGLVTAGADLAANDIPSGVDAAKISAGNVSNTEFDFLDGVTSGIQGQLNAKASTASLTAHTGASSGVHGVSGSVVGTTDAQVLIFKDIDGGTASNSSRLTVPKAATATLSGLTRKQGTLLYDTSLLKLFVDNGTSLDAVGSGSGTGTGSLNIVTNPSATDNTTGWTAATNYTVSRDTSNSPLASVISSCFAISTTTASAEASTSGVYAASLSMPAALRSTKIQVSMYLTVPASSLGVWRVSVYNASGTRMSLSSDSSSVTTLPAGFTGQYAFTFDADTSATYTISFTQTTRTSANTLYATLISIGNGQVVQGAAISDPVTYTPATSQGLGTLGTSNLQYRRVGSNMHVSGRFAVGTTTAAQAQFGLPTGFTVGANNGSVTFLVGKWDSDAAGATTVKQGTVIAVPGNAYVTFSRDDYTTATGADSSQNGNALWAAGQTIYCAGEWVIPIAQWQGSGTVNLGQGAQEEYVSSTTGTWDAAAAAGNTVYGPSGSPISGSLTANRTKVCRLQYPLQATDRLQLQYQLPSTGAWVDQDQSPRPFFSPPGINFGAYISAATVGSTDITVTFNQYALAGTTYNSATGAGNWSSADLINWRVVRYRSSSPVGFGLAGTDGSSGLYKAGQAPGLTSGAAIGAGYIGEVLTGSLARASATSITSGATGVSITSRALTAGTWLISGVIGFTGTATATTQLRAAISTSNGGTPAATEFDSGLAVSTSASCALGTIDQLMAIQPVLITTSGTPTYFLNVFAAFSGGTCTAYGQIRAVRIA